MPICPNCGSYVSEGSHTCSCGTSFSYNSYEEKEEEDPEEVERRQRGRQCYLEASSLEREGRYHEAIMMYQRSSDLGYSGFTRYKLASIYYKMGDYERALEIYQSLGLSGRDYTGTRMIGSTLCCLERYDEALDKFFKAIGIINESSEFIQDYTNPNYGIYYTQEELDGYAREKLRKKRIELAKVYKEIAWAYKCQKNYKVAVKYIDEAIDFDETEPDYLNVKAIILEEMKCFSQSKEYYDLAIESDPDVIFIENRARMVRDWCRDICDNGGNLKEAERMIVEAIDSLSGIETEEDIYEYVVLKNEIRDRLESERQEKLLRDIGRSNLITIAGTRYYGYPNFTKGKALKLVSEPGNEHDPYAVSVYMDGEKVGYVANSHHSACYLTSQASNLDIGDCADAEYLFNYLFKHHVARIVGK